MNQDEEVKDEMVEISGGFLGVPYTVIKKCDGLKKIVGFDKAKLIRF